MMAPQPDRLFLSLSGSFQTQENEELGLAESFTGAFQEDRDDTSLKRGSLYSHQLKIS